MDIAVVWPSGYCVGSQGRFTRLGSVKARVAVVFLLRVRYASVRPQRRVVVKTGVTLC